MDFLSSLTGDEGDELLTTWWSVNARFFIRRAFHRIAMGRAEREAEEHAKKKVMESVTAASSPA
ncbi:hypothetical protein CLD22_27865 [Rubrivivax gelatinosus]|nr:hypothetical protein [Rubrivivax gelatinosus]